jgi:hypothetical protein
MNYELHCVGVRMGFWDRRLHWGGVIKTSSGLVVVCLVRSYQDRYYIVGLTIAPRASDYTSPSGFHQQG